MHFPINNRKKISRKKISKKSIFIKMSTDTIDNNLEIKSIFYFIIINIVMRLLKPELKCKQISTPILGQLDSCENMVLTLMSEFPKEFGYALFYYLVMSF